MYVLRHLAYVALTGVRKALVPRFWLRGVWIWLVWDAAAWLRDSIELLMSRSRQVECECCGWCGRRFFLHTYVSGTTVHRFKEEICPRCESLGRQRQLVRYLVGKLELLSSDGTMLLDIGPGKADLAWFARRGLPGIITVDIRPGAAMLAMDITRMGFKDGVFDLIVCSHVLEHVPDDGAALREMLRVLKPSGMCVVQVPIQPGLAETVEYSGPNPEEFGHVRAYGSNFPLRLSAAGFAVAHSENGLFEVARKQVGFPNVDHAASGRQH